MSDEIELSEAWVNLPYGANMNRLAPDLNQASPGQPYFTDPKSAAPGQWVRIVCRTSDGATFWLVELLDRAIRVGAIAYENGDPAPSWFCEARWSARFELHEDGNWYLVEMAEE